LSIATGVSSAWQLHLQLVDSVRGRSSGAAAQEEVAALDTSAEVASAVRNERQV
jgi:hypothetical protein